MNTAGRLIEVVKPEDLYAVAEVFMESKVVVQRISQKRGVTGEGPTLTLAHPDIGVLTVQANGHAAMDLYEAPDVRVSLYPGGTSWEALLFKKWMPPDAFSVIPFLQKRGRSRGGFLGLLREPITISVWAAGVMLIVFALVVVDAVRRSGILLETVR